MTPLEDDAIREAVRELSKGLFALRESADAIYCNHEIANMHNDHVSGIVYLMKQEADRLMGEFHTVEKALKSEAFLKLCGIKS